MVADGFTGNGSATVSPLGVLYDSWLTTTSALVGNEMGRWIVAVALAQAHWIYAQAGLCSIARTASRLDTLSAAAYTRTTLIGRIHDLTKKVGS